MESNWRWNVSELGLYAGDVRLIARSLTNPALFISDNLADPTTGLVWSEPAAPGQLPSQLFAFPTFGTHFPYGALVEPD